MSGVSERLLETTEAVMNILELVDDCSEGGIFDKIQNWIMDNRPDDALYYGAKAAYSIADAFRRENICPQCLTVTMGDACCAKLERI